VKRYLLTYALTALVLIPVDFLFLGTIGKKLFNEHVADMVLSTPRILPAILFYVIYIAGVVALVNGPAPAAWQHNAIYGALSG
jgi:uncharacterized membrane protein